MAGLTDKIVVSSMHPYEGALTAAALCVERGLRPYRLRVSPSTHASLTMSLRYLHEYIDEEDRSYFVLRIPERLLVYTDTKLKRTHDYGGASFMECRNPDVEVEVELAC